jgi:hypothetical protein
VQYAGDAVLESWAALAAPAAGALKSAARERRTGAALRPRNTRYIAQFAEPRGDHFTLPAFVFNVLPVKDL